MKLFNRDKKQDSQLPQEVQEYYQSERRERTGFAWLLAVGTLLVTILVAAALFFGGRWVYRTIFDNDDTQPTSQQQGSQGAQQPAAPSDTNDGNNSPSQTGTNTQGATTNNQNGATANQGSGNTPSQSQPSTGGAGSSTPTTPATGETQLVNTGPGDE